MNLAAHFQGAVRQFPDRPALSDASGTLTYQEWDQKAQAVAGFLHEIGVAPGARVAAFLPNSVEYLVVLYGVLWAGGVLVPLNYRFGDGDLTFALQDSGSRVLVIEARDLMRIAPLLADTPVRQVLVRGEAAAAPAPRRVRTSALADVLAAAPAAPPLADRRDGDDCLLMYTSGTTGRPKGVRQTHRNNTAAVDMVSHAWQLSCRDRLLGALPLFHVGGLQCTTLPALAVGAHTQLLARWDAREWIAALDGFQPTFSALVTTMLIDTSRHLAQGAAFSKPVSLRFVVFGGSATPVEVPDRLAEQLGTPIIELYGQTETTGLITTYDADEPRVRGSMGRIRTEVAEGAVLSLEGTVSPFQAGTTGELVLAGDIVTPGYWGAPEETAARHAGRFLRTGDVVQVGQDGYLTYLDRSDNMIVTGGENVYPSEVEAALLRHPAVVEAAVVATPHDRLVEQVTAVLVTDGPTPLTLDELRAFLRANTSLAAFKHPRRLELTDELPKTGSGKVDRAALKQRYRP